MGGKAGELKRKGRDAREITEKEWKFKREGDGRREERGDNILTA